MIGGVRSNIGSGKALMGFVIIFWDIDIIGQTFGGYFSMTYGTVANPW